ncbi:MAG: ribosome maturation factor RimM [Bacteroidales bacterium]|nr:ribosome maturation factor RimM [Bacteroidales bacterium]
MIPISELDLIKIGEIFKTHGYKGELVIKLSIDFDRLKKTELIFLEIEGNPVPFFFSGNIKSYKKTGIIAKFESVDTKEDVKELVSCQVYTTKDNIFDELEDESTNYENFDVYNKDTYIGKSIGFMNIPSNPVLTIITESNKEILIPFNDEFIVEIDEKNQKIIFDLPEGLVDVNF